MPEIRPFKGIKYNLKKIKNFADVITQPYDQITDEMEKDYKNRSPYNFVRLTLTKYAEGHNRAKEYEEAKGYLNNWLKDGIFIQDDKESIYSYFQEFTIDNKRYLRKGLICRVRLEELGKGNILPHEKTLSKPKEDRLNLLRIAKKDFEPVFLLYPDPKNYVTALIEEECDEPAMIDVVDNRGVKHKLWQISRADLIDKIAEFLKKTIFVIADGHHRYETAFDYLKELGDVNRNHSANFKMVTLVNIQDPGLVILPTHRLVKNLTAFNEDDFLKKSAEFFVVKKTDKDRIGEALVKEKSQAFGFYSPKSAYILKLKSPEIIKEYLSQKSKDYQGLDVVILHTLLIERVLGISPERIEDHIRYERGVKETMQRVDSAEFQFCFLMSPTKPEQVKEVAQHRERMPQKSTDFYPKLISGLVFYDIG